MYGGQAEWNAAVSSLMFILLLIIIVGAILLGLWLGERPRQGQSELLHCIVAHPEVADARTYCDALWQLEHPR